MNGGVDIEIPTHVGATALDRGARIVLRFWPGAVFVDGDTGAKTNTVDDLPSAALRELLIYRDAAIEERWELEGAVPELRDTLVHLLADQELITVVVDDPESIEMRPILEALHAELASRGNLQRNGGGHRQDTPEDVAASSSAST